MPMLDKHGFDRWAGSYDSHLASRLDSFPFIGYYDVLAAVLARIEPRPGMRVLDVGIGTGLLSEALSKHGCSIYGVDFSEQMLEKARARIPDAVLDAVDVTNDYLGRFSGQRFDRLVSTYFFHHLDSRQKLTFIQRALVQNLEAGGMIVIADVAFATENAFDAAHRLHADAWDEDEYYLCGKTIVQELHDNGITAAYDQISPCAGLLVCKS